MKEQSMIDFLKFRDYDIRKTQSARWIDQNAPLMCYLLLLIVF